jgi:hypothetical protein
MVGFLEFWREKSRRGADVPLGWLVVVELPVEEAYAAVNEK